MKVLTALGVGSIGGGGCLQWRGDEEPEQVASAGKKKKTMGDHLAGGDDLR